MPKFAIETKMFDDPKTGNAVPYDRLVISGYLFGKKRTVELKLDKSQLELVSLLIDSDEGAPSIDSRKATASEGEKIVVRKAKSDVEYEEI